MRNYLFILSNFLLLISCVSGDIDAQNAVACGGGYDAGKEICDVRDGTVYKIVIVGEQIWMAQNANYKSKETASLCYQNDETNCEKYGRLYPFSEREGICPAGYRIPSIAEWDILAENTGREDSDQNLKAGGDSWLREGDDTYGFSAFPGGAYKVKNIGEEATETLCGESGSVFDSWDGLGEVAIFMSSSTNDYWVIANDGIIEFCFSKDSFSSVRCIKK